MSLAVHEAGPGTSRLAERRSFGSRARRFGLAVFFASVAVNTAFGIYAVLAPDFGETQGKIVGTSLCITAAVVLALACEPAWQRKLLGPVPAAGAVLGAVGFSLAVAGIWAEPESEIWERRWETSSPWPSHARSRASSCSRDSRPSTAGSSA